MGSRAVVIVCRDEETARRRFGVLGKDSEFVNTRTGRRFFDDARIEQEFFKRSAAVDAAGFWGPVSDGLDLSRRGVNALVAKAQELLRQQYAPSLGCQRQSLTAVVSALEHPGIEERGRSAFTRIQQHRLEAAIAMSIPTVTTVGRVHSVSDLKLAPFHLLATEGQVHVHETRVAYGKARRHCKAGDGLLLATPIPKSST